MQHPIFRRLPHFLTSWFGCRSSDCRDRNMSAGITHFLSNGSESGIIVRTSLRFFDQIGDRFTAINRRPTRVVVLISEATCLCTSIQYYRSSRLLHFRDGHRSFTIQGFVIIFFSALDLSTDGKKLKKKIVIMIIIKIITIKIIIPKPAFQHIQKAWDGPVVNSIIDRMVSAADTDIDLARLKAASAPHSGECGAHSMRRPLRRLALSSLTWRYAYPSHSGWVSPHALLTTAFVGSWMTPEVYTSERDDVSLPENIDNNPEG